MALLPISPYITWKGLSTNSAVPSFSRPDLTVSGPEFKANPIKHWRKQLIPSENSGNRNRRAAVGIPNDTPGGSVYLGNVNENTDCLLNASSVTSGIKENIIKVNNTNFVYDLSDCLRGSCNSQRNYIRSATTILNKNYHVDRKSYLRSRCNLYDQNLNSNITHPNCTDCPNTTANCQSIYKPNNKQYSKQGAVDSSDRITRLKLNTVNKNAASYKELFGSTASRYLGMASTPYFVKSKYQVCVPLRKTGNNTICETA
jgi:hypothetical protein